MVARDAVTSHPPDLRCDHCGRSVSETLHTRTTYKVDYYSMHTGPVETCSLVSEDGERRLMFQKLLRAEEVVTCVDCYAKADVRHDRELRYRVELAADERTSER